MSGCKDLVEGTLHQILWRGGEKGGLQGRFQVGLEEPATRTLTTWTAEQPHLLVQGRRDGARTGWSAAWWGPAARSPAEGRGTSANVGLLQPRSAQINGTGRVKKEPTVWNSAMRFCESRHKRLRPRISGMSCDSGSLSLLAAWARPGKQMREPRQEEQLVTCPGH